MLTVTTVLSAYAEEKKLSEVPLDGVYMEAVETYLLPKKNQLGLGVGYWPTNAFYDGFGVNLSLQNQISRRWAWEVLKGTFLMTVDKSLTNNLAENFGVAPREIERINYVAQTSLVHYGAYGKFIFKNEFVRYFRMGLTFGAGMIGYDERSEFVPTLGAKMEVYGSNRFSWVATLQNYLSLQDGFENIMSVEISSTYSF